MTPDVTPGRLAFALVCRALTLTLVALALAFAAIYSSDVRWLDVDRDREVPATTTTGTDRSTTGDDQP
jgi:hypothetical protein